MALAASHRRWIGMNAASRTRATSQVFAMNGETGLSAASAILRKTKFPEVRQADVSTFYMRCIGRLATRTTTGSRLHEMLWHLLLGAYMDPCVTAAGIGVDKGGALFRTLGGRGRKQLSAERMRRQTRGVVWRAARPASSRSWAATCSVPPALPSTCSMVDFWSTRSRWPRIRASERPRSTTAAAIRSRSTRLSGLFSEECACSSRSQELCRPEVKP
jgi:hypothetical protein